MIIKAIIVIALSVAVFLTITKGFEGMEINECQKWQREKQEFQDWYPTDWQEEQCQAYGIDL